VSAFLIPRVFILCSMRSVLPWARAWFLINVEVHRIFHTETPRHSSLVRSTEVCFVSSLLCWVCCLPARILSPQGTMSSRAQSALTLAIDFNIQAFTEQQSFSSGSQSSSAQRNQLISVSTASTLLTPPRAEPADSGRTGSLSMFRTVVRLRLTHLTPNSTSSFSTAATLLSHVSEGSRGASTVSRPRKCPYGHRLDPKSSGCKQCNELLTRTRSSFKFVCEYFPKLAPSFHPTMNGCVARTCELSHIWWICSKNPSHVWRDTIQSRIKSSKCPVCSSKHVGEFSPLEITKPKIAASLHLTKNTPEQIHNALNFLNVNEKIWWQCANDASHSWSVSLKQRVSPPVLGCPECREQKERVKRAPNPEKEAKLREQWHERRNKGPPPEKLDAAKAVWWQCPESPDHVWKSSPMVRRANMQCPFCVGNKLSITYNLATEHPHLAKEFHPTLNGSLKVTSLWPSDKMRVWWQCSHSKEHVWKSSPASRHKSEGKCPFCINLRTSKSHNMAKFYPNISSLLNEELSEACAEELHTQPSVPLAFHCCKDSSFMFQRTLYNCDMNRIEREIGSDHCQFCTRAVELDV